MGATRDMELAKETLEFIDKARDQDVMYFFNALGSNFQTRRLLTQHFQENFDAVRFFTP
jgi:aminopeptidase 2